jgi:hypothetical protein
MSSTTTPKTYQDDTHTKLCVLFDAMPKPAQMWILAKIIELIDEFPSAEAVKNVPVHHGYLH